jgi:hypothetical protein
MWRAKARVFGLPCAADEEQIMIETYYKSVNPSFTFYYIGLDRPGGPGSNWYLLDGTNVGNGVPSNANPYAHW